LAVDRRKKTGSNRDGSAENRTLLLFYLEFRFRQTGVVNT